MRTLRQIGLELGDQPVGLEPGDEHRARAAPRQRGNRPGAIPQYRGADARHIRDKDLGDLDAVQPENLGEPLRRAMRIDDRGRSVAGESHTQRARRLCRMRVGQRLIERVAAAEIIEGFDAQRHDRPDITQADRSWLPS